jgi:hypothetical protein
MAFCSKSSLLVTRACRTVLGMRAFACASTNVEEARKELQAKGVHKGGV